MNNRRQSTNYKLQAIINSNASAEQTEQQYRSLEKKAKQRLQRACLYGGGARTILPKTKRVKQPTWSPFRLPGAETEPLPPKSLVSSIPPGAHNDLYRVVTNLTQVSANDPDRIFVNSTSMLEGLRALPQPPWYVGYSNKIVPSDDDPMTSAARYGFRGSRNIKQFNTKPYEAPSKTQTDYTPKFLQTEGEYINEYVPPILAATVNTVNGMETPKLWPENTEYVEGYPLKKLPKPWKYKRETTVDLPERPKSPDPLSKLHSKTLEQTKLLSDYVRQESQNTLLSLPLSAKLKFETTWSDEVRKDATGTLKSTLRRLHSPYEAHTLLDPSDSLRYTGSTSMIVHTKSTDELKFRLRMEKTKSKVHTPFSLKWQHVIGHFDNISHKLKKHQSMSDAISKIAQLFSQVAIDNGSQTALKRIEFIQACASISFFEDVSNKQLSQIYSIFDPMKKNQMRFVEFILLLVILDHPEQEPIPKLRLLWNYANQYGLDRSLFDIAFEVLSSCVGSVEELNLIEKLFKEEFRPRCYEYAVKNIQTSRNIDPAMTGKHVESRQASKTHNATNNNQLNDSAKSFSSQPHSPTQMTPTKTTLNAAPSAETLQKASFLQNQYNICEHYLNEHTLGVVVADCPELLKEFDAQLSSKLRLCYGKDDRHKEEVEEYEPTEHLDFTWIIKKAPPKKAEFGLFDQQDV